MLTFKEEKKTYIAETCRWPSVNCDASRPLQHDNCRDSPPPPIIPLPLPPALLIMTALVYDSRAPEGGGGRVKGGGRDILLMYRGCRLICARQPQPSLAFTCCARARMCLRAFVCCAAVCTSNILSSFLCASKFTLNISFRAHMAMGKFVYRSQRDEMSPEAHRGVRTLVVIHVTISELGNMT